MKKVLTFVLPLIIVGSVITLGKMIWNGTAKYPKESGNIIEGSEFKDIDAMVVVDNLTYCKSYVEVITDDKIVDAEIGTVEETFDETSKIKDNSKWASTVLGKGSKIYSIKGIDKNEAVAAKDYEGWSIYRSTDKKVSQHVFTEDMLEAEKVIVQLQQDKRDITDKETIRKIALEMKKGEVVPNFPSFSNEKLYTFFFVNRDENGVGKIAHRYYLSFQDVSFEGYISHYECYKVNSDLNKLISTPFGGNNSSYDETLGGKQQIYKVNVYEPKIIIRKLVRESVEDKSEIKIVKEGDNIWKNGKLARDTLRGKYKLQVIMKDTTIKQSVLDEAVKSISNVKNVVSVNFSEGAEKNTTVLYIGFENEPQYKFDEFGDTTLILVNMQSEK